MTAEEWRTVVGFDNYAISTRGRIMRRTGGRGVRAGRILKPQPNAKGYLTVMLWQAGVGTRRSIHTLAYDTFIGGRPPGMEVNHRDGIKAHCAIDNLELATSSQNKQHASAMGLSAFGLRNGSGKLDSDQVAAIHAAVADGQSQRQVARTFGISQGHVSDIVNGKRRRREHAAARPA